MDLKMNENLETQSQCWKTHLQKLRSFSLFLDHQKNHHHQNTFFCSFRWDGIVPSLFLLGINIMGFPNRYWPQTTGKNKGAQSCNPTTRESVNWCSLTFDPQLPDPPDLQVEQSEFHIWRRCKEVMEEPSLQLKSFMVATFSDLPLQSVLEIFFGSVFCSVFLFFSPVTSVLLIFAP